MSLLASDVGGNVQQYPPGNLSSSAYVTSLTGQSWGNGTYVSSASSEAGLTNAYSYAAFSGSGSYWASSGAKYGSGTGTYTGSTVTTDVASASYSGEWLQLQLPYAIVLSSYTLTSTYLQGYTPKTVALLGSVDGSTWYTIDTRTLGGGSEAALSSASFSSLSGGSPYTKAHSMFRLVVRSGWGSATGNVLVNSIVFSGSLNLAIQNTPIVPASGTVSFAQIKAAYGNAYGSNLNAYGAGSGGASNFSFSSFRGKTAQTPAVGSNLLASVTTPLTGTNTVISPGGGIVGTAGAGSSISINLQTYTNSRDGTLTCTLSSYTGGATTVTVSGGTLTVGSTAPANGTVVVSLTNQFGNVQYVTFPYSFQATPPSSTGLVAMYTGESYTNGVWADITGNGNNAIVSGPVSIVNSGLNGTRAYLKGTSTTTVEFPNTILPPNYTLMHVTRYEPTGSTFGRILESSNVSNNFASGFVSGYTGVSYHNGSVGPLADWGNTTVGTNYGANWILSMDTNNSYRVNGVTMGTSGAGNPSYAQLAINNYQPSDFDIGCIAVYNTSITTGNSPSYEVWMGSNYGIPVATTSSTVSITLNTLGQSSNVNLASLASNCSSFSIAQNPNANTTLSFNGSSVNVTGSLQSTVNYTIYVKGVSSNGAYTFIPINVSESASTPTPTWTTLAPWNASSNAYVITGITTASNLTLTNYCSVAGGTPTFSVSSNPRLDASVSNNFLVVAGAFRNASYNVYVNAAFTSNASTTSNLTSFNITESPITTSAMTLGASNTNPNLISSNAYVDYVYLSSPASTYLAGGTTSYSLITQSGSWTNSLTGIMSINSGNGQLTINPGFRGNGTVPTYTALVTASVTLNSATASNSISIPITEAALPTPIWTASSISYTKSGQTMSNDTWTFNLNGLCSATVGGLSYVVPSGGVSPSQTVTPYTLTGTSNSVLNINGAYRGGSYGITVQATATYTATNGNVITSTANSAYAFSVTEIAFPSPVWSGTSGALSSIASPVGSFTLNVAPYISCTDTSATLYYYATCASSGSTLTPSTWAPVSTTLSFTAGTSGSTQTIYVYAYAQEGSFTTQSSPTSSFFTVKELPVAPVWSGTNGAISSYPVQTGSFTIANISTYVSCSTSGSSIYYYAACTGSGTITPSSWATTATSLVFTAGTSGNTQTITVYAYSQGPDGATTVANPSSSSFSVREFPAAPSLSTNNAPTYGTYSGSTYPITWTFGVANTTSVSFSTYSGFTGTPTVAISGNTVTVSGSVAAKTAPSATLSLTDLGADTVSITITTSSYTASVASPTIPPTVSTNNGASYVYNGGAGYYGATWTFTVANATNVSFSTYSGFTGTPTVGISVNTVTVTGNVAVSTVPSVTLVLTNVSAGYTTASLTTTSYSASVSPVQPSTAAPTLTSNNTPTYGTYSGSSYPITWTFGVTNSTNVVFSTYSGFTGTPTVAISGNTVTVSGSVAAKTAPLATLILSDVVTNYTTSSLTTSSYTASVASPTIPPTVSTNNGASYTYNGGAGYYTLTSWTFTVANATNVSFSTYSGFTGIPTVGISVNTVTVTGNVAVSTVPNVTLVLTNVSAGYTTASLTTTSYSASAAPAQPSTAAPTLSTNNAPTYGTYSGSTFPITWTFGVTNTTNVSFSTYSGFTGTPTVGVSGNTVTVSGSVAAKTAPLATLILSDVVTNYTTSSLTTASYTASLASPTIPPTVSTNNGASYGAYSGGLYPITSWTFTVANATNVSFSTYSGFTGTPTVGISVNTVTVTGNVAVSTVPNVTLVLTNVSAGYTTSSLTTGSYSASAAPAQPSATTPSVTVNSGVSYGAYNGSTYPVTWNFTVANTTSATYASSTNFTGTPTATLSGGIVYVAGYVTAHITPSITFNLYNAVTYYTTSSLSPGYTAGSASPVPTPTFTVPGTQNLTNNSPANCGSITFGNTLSGFNVAISSPYTNVSFNTPALLLSTASTTPTVYVYAAFRNASYSITISATNTVGGVTSTANTQTFTINESGVPAPTLSFPSTFTYTAASAGGTTTRTISLSGYCGNYNTQGCTTVFVLGNPGYNTNCSPISGQTLSFTTYDRSANYYLYVNVYNQYGSAVSGTNGYYLIVQENLSGSQFAASYPYTYINSAPFTNYGTTTVSWDGSTLYCNNGSLVTASITSSTTFTAFGLTFTLTLNSGSDRTLSLSNGSTWTTIQPRVNPSTFQWGLKMWMAYGGAQVTSSGYSGYMGDKGNGDIHYLSINTQAVSGYTPAFVNIDNHTDWNYLPINITWKGWIYTPVTSGTVTISGNANGYGTATTTLNNVNTTSFNINTSDANYPYYPVSIYFTKGWGGLLFGIGASWPNGCIVFGDTVSGPTDSIPAVVLSGTPPLFYHVWGRVFTSYWDSYWGTVNGTNYYEAVRTSGYGDATNAIIDHYYNDADSSGYDILGSNVSTRGASLTGWNDSRTI